MHVKELFHDLLPVIRAAARGICRRNGLTREATEDFESDVVLRFMENDYEMLRRHRGRCSMKTWVSALVGNLYQDLVVRKKDVRFRNSATASQLARKWGWAAEALEKLLNYEGRSLNEAVRILLAQGCRWTREQLEELAEALPPPQGQRRYEDDAPLAYMAQPGAVEGVEERIHNEEHRQRLGELEAELRRALDDLGGKERTLLFMHYLDGRTITEIAKSWGEDRKPLYGILERVKKKLYRRLTEAGFDRKSIARLLEWEEFDLDLRDEDESGDGGGDDDDPPRKSDS